jgi:hypothetical protein
MKSTAPLTAAGGLTKVRPLRAHSTVTDRARVFDIVAIFDLFSDNALKGADIQSRQHWVERCLPKAFPEARIVPFGDVHQARLVSESVVDIEAFGFNFLNNLLQLRQSTKTVRLLLPLLEQSVDFCRGTHNSILEGSCSLLAKEHI